MPRGQGWCPAGLAESPSRTKLEGQKTAELRELRDPVKPREMFSRQDRI